MLPIINWLAVGDGLVFPVYGSRLAPMILEFIEIYRWHWGQ
jgi:hypothetical protein